MERTREELLLELERKSVLIEKLKQKEACLSESNRDLAEQNIQLKEQKKSLEDLILFLKRKPFLPKSEVLSDEQMNLFNEAEVENIQYDSNDDLADAESLESSDNASKSKKKTGRRRLPDFIQREDVIIDLPESEKFCSVDGSPLKKTGEEVSEKLKIIPLQIKVIRTIRYKYACAVCEEGQKTALVPPSLIPQSIATPETLAFIAVSKYEDALPLYRIENILDRNEIPISRATMAHWMIKSAAACQPLINLMKDDLLSSNYLHMDETTVQVLDEKDRKAQSKSYMWVQLSTNQKKKIVLFSYDPSRSGKSAKKLLEGFKGYLQADGYGGYNFTECENSEIVRVSCLAHIRRKFKVLFDDKALRSSFAVEVINLIRKIYDEESKMGFDRILEPGKVKSYKEKYIQPLLAKLKTLFESKTGKIPPKTPLGEALNYGINELPLLIASYAKNSEIRLDNNLVENAIRPFAVGRKNWLFSQSVAGADASATLYSLIESAKLNDIGTYDYLLYLFKKIPQCQSLEDYEKLLPYNIVPAQFNQA
jgi:transposase